MRANARRKQNRPVTIEHHAWSLWGNDARAAYENAAGRRTFWVRLPQARRVGQRAETKHGRAVLLWSLVVTDDLTVCALEAQRASFALVLQRGYTVADFLPGAVPGRSRRWHQRRAIENAKSVAAMLRAVVNECHVAEPMRPADEEWLRGQLGTGTADQISPVENRDDDLARLRSLYSEHLSACKGNDRQCPYCREWFA